MFANRAKYPAEFWSSFEFVSPSSPIEYRPPVANPKAICLSESRQEGSVSYHVKAGQFMSPKGRQFSTYSPRWGVRKLPNSLMRSLFSKKPLLRLR